jgi:hypothetical protein
LLSSTIPFATMAIVRKEKGGMKKKKKDEEEGQRAP